MGEEGEKGGWMGTGADGPGLLTCRRKGESKPKWREGGQGKKRKREGEGLGYRLTGGQEGERDKSLSREGFKINCIRLMQTESIQ